MLRASSAGDARFREEDTKSKSIMSSRRHTQFYGRSRGLDNESLRCGIPIAACGYFRKLQDFMQDADKTGSWGFEDEMLNTKWVPCLLVR